MKQRCKYHPTARAQWYCAHDGIYFCDDCVSSNESMSVASCLICGKTLTPVPTAIETTPFWQIMPQFLHYPLSLPVLVLMLVPFMLVPLMPLGWETIVILFLAGLPLGGYGLAVMQSTLSGELTKTPGLDAVKAISWPLAFQHWLVFVLGISIVAALVYATGLIAGAFLWSLMALLLPLLWFAILAYGHLPVAVSRLHVAPLILGRDYLALVATVLLAGLMVMFIGWVLIELFPDRLAASLAIIFIAWLWVGVCHLIGYLACQHQNELDIDTLRRRTALRRKKNRRPEKERRLMIQIREGRYEKILSELSAELEKKPLDLYANEQYMSLLDAMGRHEEMISNADYYLEALLKSENETRVIEWVRKFRELDGRFRPRAPDICLRVAEILADLGEEKTAISLLQDIHKRSPDWHGVADAYILISRLLARLGLNGKAEQYLKFVEKQYRHPKIRQKIDEARVELAL